MPLILPRFTLLGRFAASALVVLACAAPGYAQYHVVDSTADAPDATPGDGLCATLLGECTLRAAVEEANATPGLEFVELAQATYTRAIASELDVTDDVQILGPTNIAIVDAAGLGRVFHVRPGVEVLMHQLLVRHGSDASNEGGGGILNEGNLRLERVAVSENDAYRGAGIRNTGTLVADGSYIESNGAGSAAISNAGHVTIERTSIGYNDGAALENTLFAELQLADVGHNAGGGIVNHASLEVRQSTLWANDGYGALYNLGTARLKRSTVSGNHGDFASAVYAAGGLLELEDVTISANGGATSPQAALDGAGAATVRAINSIVAGNASSSGNPDCRVSVTSAGHNLMSCPLDAPDPTTFAADPRLAPLKGLRLIWPADYFTTLVHPLLPGSPAIDQGACSLFPDQLGGGRPEAGGGVACDIGAIEAQPLCLGGVGMSKTQLTIRRRPLPGGTTTLKVKARLLFTDPLAPPVDPKDDGLQLRIEDLGSPAGALIEHTDLTSPLTAGWEGSGLRSRWRIPAPDPLMIVVKDRRATAGFVDFKATTKVLLSPVTGPMRVTVVLGGSVLGDDQAGFVGACAAQVFTCTGDPAGTKLKCL